MRWICLFLLMVNIVYALWYGVNAQAFPAIFDLPLGGVTQTELPTSDKGKRLVLLSETNALDIEHSASLEAPDAEGSGQAIEAGVAFSKSVDSAAIEQVLTKPELIAEEELISEPELLVESPKLCWAAGPVLEPTAADHLTQRAQALASNVDRRALNVKTGEEFWVYLPALSSYKEALTQLKALQKRKIDSFVVTSGQFANAISLGLFSQRALAERHQARMRQEGINAVVEVKDRTRREYWVHFQLEQSFESGLKDRIQGELSKLNWRSLPCSERLAAD